MSRLEERRLEQAERDGRAAFLAGKPCMPASPYAERNEAWIRGWRCAEREARDEKQERLELSE